MKVSNIRIENIKAFQDEVDIDLDSQMNILIGENNAGKSIIIKSINLLQNQSSISSTDIRYGKSKGKVIVSLENIDETAFKDVFHINDGGLPKIYFEFDKPSNNIKRYVATNSNQQIDIGVISSKEPDNYIYPFFSKRRVSGFSQNVTKNNTLMVGEDLQNLVSKVDRIADPEYDLFEEYKKACIDIIGFPVSSFSSDNGHQAGITIGRFESIPLESMGDGIPNLLGLIVNLCVAKNRLFLIEEIENDIHPKALKSLLDLIISKSKDNQFVISTHSNIVTKYLGSIENSKLHHITRKNEEHIPTAIYNEVRNVPEERKVILEELGYEMTDYDLWKGWLILEESSIERIINDFLIPKFTPRLVGKLRTISAQGVDSVEIKFRDLDRLFLFTYLSPAYKNKVWVVIDNCDKGGKIIDSLKKDYVKSGWNDGNFITLTNDNFEDYYPINFKSSVDTILAMSNGKNKQEEKKKLLESVLDWIKKDEGFAKKEFEKSAKEIIDILKKIEKNI